MPSLSSPASRMVEGFSPREAVVRIDDSAFLRRFACTTGI
jgi:hypothetical protein